jgi:hypothetical protein
MLKYWLLQAVAVVATRGITQVQVVVQVAK